MRARELWGIKVADIPGAGTKLKILRQSLGGNSFATTKGKDARFVPFSESLREELNSILMHETELRAPESTLLLNKILLGQIWDILMTKKKRAT